ncbi:MAG: hypothetical protein PWR01_4345, partial [Clostridiales bacterium]|nr:hypothetical protein [Clostridiales bacterium]MDN5283272.1 hypothetical protein [Candidatus Ozemobacter sp.]
MDADTCSNELVLVVQFESKMIECFIGISCKGRRADALVLETEEGRGQLR